MASVTEKPAKVLCLHGFGQSAAVLKQRMASFRGKLAKTKYEFVYLNAPHELPARKDKDKDDAKKDTADTDEEGAFAWYYYSDENKGDVEWDKVFNKHSIKDLKGLDASVSLINDALQNAHKDAAYIIGFSQGGAMLSVMTELGFIPEHIKLIFVSAFFPGLDTELSQTFPHKSQHVYSEADTIIPAEQSKNLANHFPDKVETLHVAGHVFPRFKPIA